MAVDVVGYSRLTERDEDGAVRRLRELQVAITPVVESGNGRIANTAGDAMLVEFSSSVAALDSALTIQAVAGLFNRGVGREDQMLLRIRVNVGDVIVEGGDVFGEVVNIASRLEALAEAGGICVSHVFYLQTKGRFAVDFVDLGEQRLKNIANPVRAYAVRPLRGGRRFEQRSAATGGGRGSSALRRVRDRRRRSCGRLRPKAGRNRGAPRRAGGRSEPFA